MDLLTVKRKAEAIPVNTVVETPPRLLKLSEGYGFECSSPLFEQTHDHSTTRVCLLEKSSSHLSKLEQEALSRRALIRTRIRDLYQRISIWLSQYASEVLERDASFVAIDTVLSESLDTATDRVLNRLDDKLEPLSGSLKNDHRLILKQMDQQGIVESGSNVTSGQSGHLRVLERQLTSLSYCLQEYVHDSIPKLIGEKLEKFEVSLQLSNPIDVLESNMCDQTVNSDCCDERINSMTSIGLQTLQRYMQLEVNFAQQREAQIIRHFESIAGMITRNLLEEECMRVTSLKLMEKEIEKQINEKREQTNVLFSQLDELKTMLEVERENRVQGDENVVQTILREKSLLQEKILQAFDE